jgi:mRNA-degrading endonuclease YafQ of YafQ-DinJ toxin-antitoxin module
MITAIRQKGPKILTDIGHNLERNAYKLRAGHFPELRYGTATSRSSRSLLLIYARPSPDVLRLVRPGSHSDLFD